MFYLKSWPNDRNIVCRNICWVQQFVLVWPPCCDVLQHVGCCWFKSDHFQQCCPTLLQCVALKCWDHLAGTSLWRSTLFRVSNYYEQRSFSALPSASLWHLTNKLFTCTYKEQIFSFPQGCDLPSLVSKAQPISHEKITTFHQVWCVNNRFPKLVLWEYLMKVKWILYFYLFLSIFLFISISFKN